MNHGWASVSLSGVGKDRLGRDLGAVELHGQLNLGFHVALACRRRLDGQRHAHGKVRQVNLEATQLLAAGCCVSAENNDAM